MKINDFKIKEERDEKGNVNTPSNQEMTLNILNYAVSTAYSEDKGQQGRVSTLSGGQGRMWGRIQRKMDDAIDTKEEEVDFDASETEFLKKAMEKANFPTAWFRWTVLVEDALDEK